MKTNPNYYTAQSSSTDAFYGLKFKFDMIPNAKLMLLANRITFLDKHGFSFYIYMVVFGYLSFTRCALERVYHCITCTVNG